MKAERRYTALSMAAAADVEALADQILTQNLSVHVIAGPEVVTTPIRYPVGGSDGSTSVLGHVALSTCAIELDGVRGDGVRMGRDLVGAVAAAVCDAEAERDGAFVAHVVALCEAAESSRAEDGRSRASLVSATRVGGST